MSLLAAVQPTLPDLPNTWELTGRIVLAAFLGGLIGLEREINDHPSGLRTHITVAIGAALFGTCSAYAFGEFVALRNDNNYQIDVTRVASQVVVGVGFLGGGAIIKEGNNVRGLTSAAGLWVSSAVGLSVALGLWEEATAATVTLLSALILLKRPRSWLRSKIHHHQHEIVVVMPLDVDPSGVVSALGQMEGTVIHSLNVKRHSRDGTTSVEVELEARSAQLDEQLDRIRARDDVIRIEFE